MRGDYLMGVLVQVFRIGGCPVCTLFALQFALQAFLFAFFMGVRMQLVGVRMQLYAGSPYAGSGLCRLQAMSKPGSRAQR